jgi:hypothetical protein
MLVFRMRHDANERAISQLIGVLHGEIEGVVALPLVHVATHRGRE